MIEKDSGIGDDIVYHAPSALGHRMTKSYIALNHSGFLFKSNLKLRDFDPPNTDYHKETDAAKLMLQFRNTVFAYLVIQNQDL